MTSPVINNAIILAAGQGKRLSPNDEGASKALIDMGPETLLDFQIRQLEAAGIEKISIVTGFKADAVKEHLRERRVVTYHNPDFATTNSLYSLGLAEQAARKGALIVNSDVLFHPSLLKKLLNDPAPNAILVDFDSDLGEEEMKVQAENGVVTAISKELAPGPQMGENVGLIKLSAETSGLFFKHARVHLMTGGQKAWAPKGIALLFGKATFNAIPVDGTPWTEIDFPEDLDRARNEVYPLCTS
ncbi:phosphocholine cytidylyltransferase family protein [bacterium]|nr:phosphocholine cytidylyltransferase family protein [bacterium]